MQRISGGGIDAIRYSCCTFVLQMQPVIIQQVSFRAVSTFRACAVPNR